MLSKTLAGLALGAATAEAFAPTPMGMFGSRAGIEKRAGIAAQPLVAAPVASRRATVSAVQGLKAAETKTGLPASVKPGVVTGQALVDLLQYAKDKKFAMPGVNIVGTNSINACMEAAAKYGGPIMVTFSKGGGQFIAGKTLANDKDQASIAGTIAGARHVREVAKLYGVPVVLHTDHCQKAWLPWIDGLMTANEEHFKQHGEPLFSSHMLDLSEEPDEENIEICAKYFKRMMPMKIILEMEIGITGGVEDGVDNSGVSKEKLYSTPEDVFNVHRGLAPIGEMFTIAAAFGNVHGVYKPGNVKLQPDLLDSFQKHLEKKVGYGKPFFFVFHGGSGSEKEDIDKAVSYGVVK